MNISLNNCEPTHIFKSRYFKSEEHIKSFICSSLRVERFSDISAEDLIYLQEYHELLHTREFIISHCSSASPEEWKHLQGILSRGRLHYSPQIIPSTESRIIFFWHDNSL